MELKKNDPQLIGKEILKRLEEVGILMLQDKSFPSVVSTITGKSIQGSWWGHPMANPIYNGLNWAIHRKSILSAKLLAKKVTYIHRRLYPLFFSIVNEVRPWQTKGLSKEAMDLLKAIAERKNGIRSDDSELKLKHPSLKKHIDDLETRLLVYANEIHTESGKHAKELKLWARSEVYNGKIEPYDSAIEKFNSLVTELNERSGSNLRLPWAKK